ncbi:MAG: phosphoribosylformylglycinamidine synthase I [Anaerolineae bacterium]|nr:phosphoribosylformylglycinamidine synthase I [Anaerolineae bacterium]
MMKPKILILHATGSNRDREAAWACELVGGLPEIVHINQLGAGERRLSDYQMLVLPGGFSYGDDLGAGKLWAVALRHRLADELAAFVEAGRPVLGICNGFQALVKAGLLPGDSAGSSAQTATLTRNDSAQFECRWVYLQPQPESPCIFTRGLTDPIYCPVAHGEGKFVTGDAAALAGLEARGGVALRYVDGEGRPAGYPWNPNGSAANVAGICNPAGTILGLMPHPEDHLIPAQHPQFHRGQRGWLGLPLFQNGVRYAAEV